MESSKLKDRISRAYSQMIQESEGCCDGPEACRPSYPMEMVEGVPEGAVSFGCGNPVALAAMQTGQTVLDLGSGAGLDCILAAREVGPSGSVIGIDFTQVMIDKATENVATLGLDNVSFRLGDIEALPVEDASVDVVISNCVINLAPDKDAVFREAYRVLQPGGRLMVSDIVLTRPATDEEAADMALVTGCISGSLPVEEYLSKIRDAGFADVVMDTESPPLDGQFWFSAAISATKP